MAFEQVINKDTGEESRSAGLFVLIAFSSVGVPELPGDNGHPCLVLTSGPSSSGGATLSLSGCRTAFASGQVREKKRNFEKPESRKQTNGS